MFIAGHAAKLEEVALKGTNLSKFYEAGRVHACVADLGGVAVKIHSVYGWTGSMHNAEKRALANQLLDAVMAHAQRRPRCEAIIMGDINAELEALPAMRRGAGGNGMDRCRCYAGDATG